MNKSLEQAARRNPSRVPVQAEASTAGGALARHEPIESSPYLAQMMLWLDTRTPGGASMHQLEQEFPEGPVPLALQLEQRGLGKLLRAASGPMAIHLNDEGRVEVHRLKKLQESRAARLRHTVDAFLRWLYDTAGDQTSPNPTLFLATPWSYFAGAEISETELHQALAHLAENDLIECIDTDPATVTITPQGARCVLAGGNVQDHTNRQRPGDNVTFNIGENTGNIAANSRDFTMNATTNKDGVDPAQVVMLARALRQAAPALELPEDDALEFVQLATRLETEATGGSPDLDKLHRWGNSVLSILNSPLISGALGSALAAYAGMVLPGLSPA